MFVTCVMFFSRPSASHRRTRKELPMILKASQRSGARALADHLQNARDNDIVELHDIRGCVSDDDLTAAFVEMDAQAQGTRCQKMLFSVSFNPPAHENASYEQFED